MRGTINLAAITRYRYSRDREIYEKAVYRDVAASFEDSVKVGKGMEYRDGVIIRVFTDADIDVKPGDKICLWDCATERPPEDIHTVISVRDNRRAVIPSSRHFRISCGRGVEGNYT